jgi:protein TonB
MVPPEEIDLNAPTTLPADFGEWDSGDSPAAAQPAAVSAPEAVPSPAPKPAAKAATARVAVLPAAGRTPSAPPRPAATAYAEVEQVYQQPQPQRAKAVETKQKDESAGKEKKTGTFAVIGVLVLLAAGGGGGYWYLKIRPKAVPANQPVVSTTTTATANAPKPATPAQTNGNTPATTNLPAPAVDTAAADRALRQQSEAISQQASAPSRISSDLRVLSGREAPPPADIGMTGSEGLGTGSVPFSGSSGPRVRVAPQKVSISSGVAVGLLVQKNTPVYPPIAKQAHVSGTVVIQATISKTGAVGNLRAVSGPAMLRQSALDSVKTWRFRPYMLDGEPVEVDTTVNVTFALAQ